MIDLAVSLLPVAAIYWFVTYRRPRFKWGTLDAAQIVKAFRR